MARGISRNYLKKSRVSKGDQEKIMRNFNECLFLALEFPIFLHFRRISRGLALFCLEFPGLK